MQLPDFVRNDYPTFKRFIELYYEWLEDESKGNTVYHIMNSEKYRDIDQTIDPFIRIFKNELLPYFPEKTELDLVKILKGAREFYIKKGSEESLKWLFRVLFAQEIEIYYPKQQILKASDGKWKLPKAFQLTLSAENESINPNLLEKRKGVGSESKATCVVESANKTIDPNFGNEILEIYVSNVFREFINGEQLEITYTDEDDVEQVFSEKIIGAISSIRIDSTIRTDPQQIRRGLSYNVGDPVIVFGGLDSTAEAVDAIAYVGNVSFGSVEGINPVFPGYGYRTYTNSISTIYRSEGDDPAANSSTDVRVVGLNTTNVATNSQATFLEVISVDKMPIDYLLTEVIGGDDATEGSPYGYQEYEVFTSNNRNIVLNLTEQDDDDPYINFERVYANSSSGYASANFKARIATSNSSGFGQGVSAYTGDLLLYNVQLSNAAGNIVFSAANLTNVLGGVTEVYCEDSNKVFDFNSITSNDVRANANSKIIQTLNYEDIETGGIALFNVLDGGAGFRSTPTITVSTYFDTYLSEAEKVSLVENDGFLEDSGYIESRQPISSFGQIAHVYINNPGTGYANGDSIVVGDRGYGFVGFVNVNATGSITRTTITNRGEGYYGNKTVTVTTSGGSNASLTAYGFGEGVVNAVETGAIGRIRDIRVVSRGFDYISTPIVSLKVVDMVINAIDEGETLSEGERVYQGNSLDTAIFQGIVKSYNRTTNTLRLFNYSGSSFTNFNRTLPFTSEGGVVFTIDLEQTVIAPEQYSADAQLAGLPNPYFYGNGKARAVAEFFNGLIKYPGFYINTDGFPSADKKLQDDKIYHNYSYIIESGKSISEYKNVIRDIVHPIGMSMLSRFVAENKVENNSKSNTVIYLNLRNANNSQINVEVSTGNTITGINTEFTNVTFQADVSDMVILKDSVHPLRGFAKIITSVNSDTELEVESDFTYIGQGKIKTNTEYSAVTGTASLNPAVTGTVEVNSDINGTMNVIRSSNAVFGNTAVPSNTAFTTDLDVGDIITINNQTRQVIVIANDYYLEVNSAFRFSGNDNVAYLSSNLITGSGTNFNPEVSVGDIVTVNGEIREVMVRNSDTSLVVNTPFNYFVTGASLYVSNTIVLGSGTNFNPQVNAGDIIKINNEIRRVVTVTDDTHITVNAAFVYNSTGQTINKLSNTTVTIFGNTNSVFDFIASGDQISFNIATANVFLAQTGTVQIFSSNGKVVGTSTSFSTQLAVNDIIKINNEVKKVVNIASATVMNVNSAFDDASTGELLYKLATTVNANVQFGIGLESGNVLATDLVTEANLSGVVYKVIPDYTADYDYEIITVTD